MISFAVVPYSSPRGHRMEHDTIIQDYLRQAEEAETWAERTKEPLLMVRWRKLAKEYRDLAQSRIALLQSRGMYEGAPPVDSPRSSSLN